jgi:DNA modification methylase
MQIINQEYELVPVAGLRQHPRNPRKGDTVAIAESIAHNGFYGAVVAQQGTGYVLAGNHRLKAAIDTGATEVPVIWVDADDDQALRILLADNRTNDIAGYDDAALAEILKSLDSLEGTGYDQAAVDELLASLGGGDNTPSEEPEARIDRAEELLAKWKVTTGQLWAIGKHRLLCGDSTNASDAARLMLGDNADMVFTDPPYNVSVCGGTHDSRDKKNYGKGPKIQNDSMSDLDFKGFLLKAFSVMRSVVKDGAAIYVAHADSEGINFRTAFVESGFMLKQCLIWAKQQFVFGRSDYHWQHESILYGWPSGASHNFYGERNQGTVWNIDRPMRSEKEHPTQKPVELIAKAIKNSAKSGDLLYEPFAGSGTTLVAAQQLGVRCYGIELEPKYVAVILERMSEMGLKPRLLNE